MTTLDLLTYYSNLLIFQYIGQPKASATVQANVQSILMPQVSTQQVTLKTTAGLFTLSYLNPATGIVGTTPLWPYNATDAMLQSALRALPGLSQVTVSNGLVTFTGVVAPASLLVSSNPALCTVTETDVTLLQAIENAFNITGPNVASGVQLDILGKYAGVSRTGRNNLGPITLDDEDFLTLIQFASIVNTSGSSLGTIASNLYQAFGTQISVFDYKNMQLSYLINSSIGSQDLIELLITENLIPRPMGVQISIIYANNTNNFFGFRTYTHAATLAKPFNTYKNYIKTWPWLTYTDAFNATGTSLLTESGSSLVQENLDAIYLG